MTAYTIFALGTDSGSFAAASGEQAVQAHLRANYLSLASAASLHEMSSEAFLASLVAMPTTK